LHAAPGIAPSIEAEAMVAAEALESEAAEPASPEPVTI